MSKDISTEAKLLEERELCKGVPIDADAVLGSGVPSWSELSLYDGSFKAIPQSMVLEKQSAEEALPNLYECELIDVPVLSSTHLVSNNLDVSTGPLKRRRGRPRKKINSPDLIAPYTLLPELPSNSTYL
ncbi:hypothetical protein SESBI_04866 [Sesbania bispinosa]|nr:hypothetical protein SESBI_04866 [Sesbania bispinosa]